MTLPTFLNPLNTTNEIWWITMLCAFIIGLNKSGLKGISTITIPILAHAYGGMTSVAILLPFLIFGDTIALGFYRKSIQFKYVARLLPWAFIGLIIATFTGKHISDALFSQTIGYAILFCSFILLYREFLKKEGNFSNYPFLTNLFGISGGFATMIGNAAGSIFNLYILGMRLPKEAYIATGASFYLIMNVVKLPIQALYWHSVTWDTLQLNIVCLPALLLGSFIGKRATSLIPENPYRYFIIIVTLLSALLMI